MPGRLLWAATYSAASMVISSPSASISLRLRRMASAEIGAIVGGATIALAFEQRMQSQDIFGQEDSVGKVIA